MTGLQKTEIATPIFAGLISEAINIPWWEGSLAGAILLNALLVFAFIKKLENIGPYLEKMP